MFKNSLNQPIGFPLDNWQVCEHPRGSRLRGHLCALEPLDPVRHAVDLFEAFSRDLNSRNWTYLPYGPFASQEKFQDWIESTCLGDDPCFFVIVDASSGKAVGVASFLRIVPETGVIEVGHIHFSPLIQGSAIATEAMYLMMELVFDELGYRRYEWKCDALNAPSCAAAKRLGFKFEGIFRQATMYKQRNRDTAWYSIIDREWPLIGPVFENWLSSDNFDAEGKQLGSLSEHMRQVLEG
jgi:RimJ/RimL family protein N-acetyltransferase